MNETMNELIGGVAEVIDFGVACYEMEGIIIDYENSIQKYHVEFGINGCDGYVWLHREQFEIVEE